MRIVEPEAFSSSITHSPDVANAWLGKLSAGLGGAWPRSPTV
jgi:hypothetical protein